MHCIVQKMLSIQGRPVLFGALALMVSVCGCSDEAVFPHSLPGQINVGEDGGLYFVARYDRRQNESDVNEIWHKESDRWVYENEYPAPSEKVSPNHRVGIHAAGQGIYYGSLNTTGILKGDKTGWTSMEGATNKEVYSFKKLGNYLWALAYGALLRLEGNEWNQVMDFPNDVLIDVAVTDDGRVIGIGGILAKVLTNNEVRVDTLSSRVAHVYAVGNTVFAFGGEIVFKLIGDSWSQVAELPENDYGIFLEGQSTGGFLLYSKHGIWEIDEGGLLKKDDYVMPGGLIWGSAKWNGDLYFSGVDWEENQMQAMGVVWKLEGLSWTRDWEMKIQYSEPKNSKESIVTP